MLPRVAVWRATWQGYVSMCRDKFVSVENKSFGRKRIPYL